MGRRVKVVTGLASQQQVLEKRRCNLPDSILAGIARWEVAATTVPTAAPVRWTEARWDSTAASATGFGTWGETGVRGGAVNGWMDG